MNFKDMLQKNVDNMKSKLPPLPSIQSIPNIPKLPKLKSRKIFNLNRSKENVASNIDGGIQPSDQLQSSRPYLQSPPQPHYHSSSSPSLSIINRTPTRISTISSLVEGGQQIDYNIQNINRQNRRISFEDGGDGDDNNDHKLKTTQLRLTERLTKQYKEFSEFKFSHIFGKKTIVRKTEIQVDMYKQKYQEELESEAAAAARRASTDYEFEIRSIQTEKTAPNTLNVPSLQSTPTTRSGLRPLTMSHSSINEIETTTSTTPPPLSRRKVFISNENILEDSEQKSKVRKNKSMEMDSESLRGSIKSKGSQKSRGMWKVQRAIRIPLKDQKRNTESLNTESIKKSFNNAFKKFSSNSSIDDQNGESSKSNVMFKLRRPTMQSKISTEDAENNGSDFENSEFKKQFSKIVGKSSMKIKNLISKDNPTATTTENVSQQVADVVEDPAKAKSIEEIEGLGYGRKNMKYIEKWRVRRRREIRRTEPFPLNTSTTQEAAKTKFTGMWKLQRPIRIKANRNTTDQSVNFATPQLAELTSYLMNIIKINSNINVNEQQPASNNSEETNEKMNEDSDGKNENKTGFWKKMSIKSKSTNNIDNNDEHPKEETILSKAKKRMSSHLERRNDNKTKSFESQSSQDEPVKNSVQIEIKFAKEKQLLPSSLHSFEDESDKEINEDEIQVTSMKHPWRTQKMISTVYSSESEDEETITTPGFWKSENLSTQFGNNEPTIIVVSKPTHSILQYDSLITKPLYPLLSETSHLTQSTNYSMHLELPIPVAVPTPPPPKRPSPPFDHRRSSTPPTPKFQILTPPSRQSPISLIDDYPPALPTFSPPPSPPSSMPPEFSPPKLSPEQSQSPATSPEFKSIQPIVTNPPHLYPKLEILTSPTGITRHRRMLSIDSNDSDSWMSENLINKSPLSLNKIEETYEQWNSINNAVNAEQLKKWRCIDIFNGNENKGAFEDFDDELKNEPVVEIINNNTIEKNSSPHINIESSISEAAPSNEVLAVETGILPTGIPVLNEQHKISKPLVKQASLRRQFSEEKDAEALNKKRSVNKMINRFDPERFSSRRTIKYERNQVSAVIEANETTNSNTIDIKKDVQSIEKKENIGNISRASSMDVQMDEDESQSVCGFTTEDDSSDGNDLVIKKPAIRTESVIRRKAPPPPKMATHNDMSVDLNRNIQNDGKSLSTSSILIQPKEEIKNANTLKIVADYDGTTKDTSNPKKNILASKIESEDTFYSLDFADEDETLRGYTLGNNTIVREIYTIDL